MGTTSLNIMPVHSDRPAPVMPDPKLEYLGTLYRLYCGTNDVWVKGGRIVTFEDFIKEHSSWEWMWRWRARIATLKGLGRHEDAELGVSI